MRTGHLLSPALALALLGVAPPARGDELDPLARRLGVLEVQAGDLDRAVRPPSGPPQGDPEAIERRLIQAQVAYGVGRYADASLLLYDIVEKYPGARSYPEALFYLADSLFQKGDNQVARGYFMRIVEAGSDAPHYQEALERLVELSLRSGDTSRVEEYLAKLEAIPAGKKRADSIPYVRAKYAFHSGAHDEALKIFQSIPRESKYYFQARYFAGVTLVARGALADAAKIFHELIELPTKTDAEATIVELGHLALGRIHYEKDEPSEAVDHYLLIRRDSPFFDDALYEVAFVYVKARQFDKALRALELLALTDPRSARLPDVRILEGNLRIRRAQTTALQRGDSLEEYAKATAVFEETRTTYEKPRTEVEQILASQADPRQFFHQILGRAGKTLEVQVELPEVVVTWLREDATVKRAVGVADTLDEIRKDLAETATLIGRLERAVSSPSRVSLFPTMAEKRGRAQELGQGAFKARQDLAALERSAVAKHASGTEQAALADLQETRRKAALRLARLPGSGEPYIERVRKARAQYVEIDKRCQEIDIGIVSLEAQLVALDKYHADTGARGKVVMPDAAYTPQMRELRGLVAALRAELDGIRAEINLASDEAGISNELIAEEAEAKKDLQAATAAEHAAMAPIVARMNGEEKARLERIGGLVAQADRVEAATARVATRIDAYVDAQLGEARSVILEEKVHVNEYQQLLAGYDTESDDVGGEIVGGSFDAVARKFYEIGVRADVGLLDVSWSEHEQAQGAVDRLRQDYAGEKSGIENELRSIEKEVDRATPRTPPTGPAQGKDEPHAP